MLKSINVKSNNVKLIKELIISSYKEIVVDNSTNQDIYSKRNIITVEHLLKSNNYQLELNNDNYELLIVIKTELDLTDNYYYLIVDWKQKLVSFNIYTLEESITYEMKVLTNNEYKILKSLV